ncbi:MAG: hypothetical protein LBT10_04020 [Methanobrevibacter sp.]|jgi:hypothetical protein|nr:hypothetical protein [Methanobrevibacter sp.]
MDEDLKKYLLRNGILLLMIFMVIMGSSLLIFGEMNKLVDKIKEPMNLSLNFDNGSLENVLKNTSHTINIPNFEQETENFKIVAQDINNASQNLKDIDQDIKDASQDLKDSAKNM